MPYKETLRKEFEEEWRKSEDWSGGAFGARDPGCDGMNDNCCGNCGGPGYNADRVFDWFLSKIPTIIEEEKKQWKEEAVKEVVIIGKSACDEYGNSMCYTEDIIRLIKEL